MAEGETVFLPCKLVWNAVPLCANYAARAQAEDGPPHRQLIESPHSHRDQARESRKRVDDSSSQPNPFRGLCHRAQDGRSISVVVVFRHEDHVEARFLGQNRGVYNPSSPTRTLPNHVTQTNSLAGQVGTPVEASPPSRSLKSISAEDNSFGRVRLRVVWKSTH